MRLVTIGVLFVFLFLLLLFTVRFNTISSFFFSNINLLLKSIVVFVLN